MATEFERLKQYVLYAFLNSPFLSLKMLHNFAVVF